jgi:hypothetical protein
VRLAELWRQTAGHDQSAARVVAKGGGIKAVIEATDLRTLDNLARLIDPTRLACSDEPGSVEQVAGNLESNVHPAGVAAPPTRS